MSGAKRMTMTFGGKEVPLSKFSMTTTFSIPEGEFDRIVDDIESRQHLVDALGNRLIEEAKKNAETFSNADPESPFGSGIDDILSSMNRLTASAKKQLQLDGRVSLSPIRMAIEKLELLAPTVPSESDPVGFYGGRECVRFGVVVADRDTGIPIRLEATYPLYEPLGENTPATRAHALRSALMDWFSHEVDEMIRVDGKRLNDPHAPLPAAKVGRPISNGFFPKDTK